MLIEFSVSNFRSIVERQTFSMVAGSSRSVRGAHSHVTGSPAVPRLLKAAAILGPNASGKSSIVNAMNFMREFVISSARESQEGEEIAVEPFLFSHATRDAPSEFEAVFLEDGTRYEYGFACTKHRVTREWLFVTPVGGRAQRWFERFYNEEQKITNYFVNLNMKGEKEVWKKSTRDNALFLSVAVQLKSESLRRPFMWFKDKFRIIRSSQRLSDIYSARKCEGADKEKILNFIQSVDINISDISISNIGVDEFVSTIPGALRESVAKTIRESDKELKFPQVQFGHLDERGGTVFLPLAQESDGTRVLFALAGPWLDVLENGRILVVDELHNSLHPLAFEMLVKIFQNKEWNNNFAQIIFTTHETHVLSQDIVHRDGIWFVESNGLAGSILTPLSDFKARTGESFDRSYLGGRYGGLPRIRLQRPGLAGPVAGDVPESSSNSI